MAGLLALALSPAAAFGQVDQRDPSIMNLPRPGYDPHTLIIGSTVVAPSVSVTARFDDNVFATPQARLSDFIFDLRPSATLRRESANLDLTASAYGNVRRYARFTRENVTTFGAETIAAINLGGRQSLTARGSFDRLFERRDDPEASGDRSRQPSLIDNAQASLSYRRQSARTELTATAAIEKINYLPEIEDDRDMLTYRASLRGSVRVKSRISVFAQPYITRRNARLAVDRTGVNRDNTTFGLQAGVALDFADRLQGDIGIGGFRAKPSEARLRAFTGLAFSGRLTWRPRVRTAITLSGFRGDVATIRAGAQSRIDTRASLAIDQEARHNLILHATAGYRTISYRGAAQRDQTYLTFETGARYLITRGLALTLDGSYTKRSADIPSERFRRWSAMVGLVVY